ncbi:MAG: hypothetical protein ACRD51_13060 [Candidatus Acidiferrum sp.]
MKTILSAVLILLFSLTSGCETFRSSLNQNSEPIVPEAGNGYLMFDLQQITDNGSITIFSCKYRGGGKTALFKFEVDAGQPNGFPPIAFVHGKLIAVPGSDSSILLQNLKKTLEAKNLPERVTRVSEVPFTAAILGTSQSHAQDGGFFVKPSGHWTAMKIFIGKKDDPAEVFLNFNTVLKKGEFSIKDSDYGDDVLRELAKVL